MLRLLLLITSVSAFAPATFGILRPSSLHAADPMQKPLTPTDYMAVGLACCFAMNDNGKLNEAWIFEPLTAGSLETIEHGIETSYKQVMALAAEDFFEGDLNEPTGIKIQNLQALGEGYEVSLCDNVIERSLAASRTFRRREEAKSLEFNEMSDEYNFSVERKRILNHVVEVNDADNVKQDMSIDVYGREEEGEGEDLKNQIEALEAA